MQDANAQKQTPMATQQQLQHAFNRARLADHGFTLESALQNSGIAICLNRLAQALQNPPPAPHWQDAF